MILGNIPCDIKEHVSPRCHRTISHNLFVDYGVLTPTVPFTRIQTFGSHQVPCLNTLDCKNLWPAWLTFQTCPFRIHRMCHQFSTPFLLLCLSQKSMSLQGFVAASERTGTPAFLAVAVLEGQQQSVGSDLESLLYSLMYIAMERALPWLGLLGRAAVDRKIACMTSNQLFSSKVLDKIPSITLRKVVAELRQLFFLAGDYRSDVSIVEFRNALEENMFATETVMESWYFRLRNCLSLSQVWADECLLEVLWGVKLTWWSFYWSWLKCRV